jgi:hypothetical protein
MQGEDASIKSWPELVWIKAGAIKDISFHSGCFGRKMLKMLLKRKDALFFQARL